MDITVLISKTITLIEGCVSGSERITIECSDGTRYAMFHTQECCESVLIEDVCGDLEDLVGSPIVQAEESINDDCSGHVSDEWGGDSETWTFYRLATSKGLVVIRWYGTSNGYYSERVDFEEIKPDIE